MDFSLTMDDKEEGKEEARRRQQQILREEVWSWGAGTDGQLGTGKLEDEHLPHLLHLPFLSSDGPISMLACGGAHVIALTSSGKVLTWGRGTSGQLGHGDMANSLNPKSVKFLEEYMIIHVSAGWSHSGFVSDTGCLFTCGDGSFGQLGHGDYLSQRTPVKVSYFNGRQVQQIACGMRHSLVLLKDCSDNQVYAFGSGKRGQLGVSTDKIKSVSLPHITCGLEGTKIVRISANGDHSAALSVDRHLYCWGRGYSGYFDASTPQHLSLSLQLIEVALGWNHALLLTGDGKVFMLGGSHHGALGDLEKMNPIKHYSDTSEAVLIQVFSLDSMRVVQIAAGAEHSALVTADGAIQTWGWGEHGQLGLGDASNQMNPQTVCLGHKVQDGEAIFRIYCGSGFTFAVRSLSSAKPDNVGRF